jgi:hypothetical protein
MLLANWPWSIFNVTEQDLNGGGILIVGDVSRVVGGKIPTISEFANNIKPFVIMGSSPKRQPKFCPKYCSGNHSP